MAGLPKSIPNWGRFPVNLDQPNRPHIPANPFPHMKTGLPGPTTVNIGADVRAPEKHYSEWHSQWTITAGIRVRAYKNSKAQFDIQENQIVFTLPSRRAGSEASTFSEPTFNLQQMNSLLYKAWTLLDSTLGSARAKLKRALNPMAVAPLRDEAAGSTYLPDPDGILKYFDLPEDCWGPLYKETSASINQNNYFKLIKWATARGIMENTKCSGIVLTPPTSYYTAPTTPQINKDINIAVAAAGNVEIENCFGPEACALSNLFLILKRLPHPKNPLEFGPYAFVPYPTVQAQPTIASRRYLDWSGATQFGPLIYIGMVLDKRGPSQKADVLKRTQGLKGTSAEQFGAAKMAPKLLCYLKKPKGRYYFG